MHGAHDATWDCRDVNGNIVPDGQYKLSAEFTEDNSSLFFNPQPKLLSIEFAKGAQPLTLMPPDQASFTNMLLAIQ